MMLRTSMLINGILYNTEALFNLKNKQTEMLEECEQGCPVESFFIETSAWPIRFILMGRKLMYYWTILKKEENELVKKVFNAQLKFPTKGDWISGVKDIMKKCDIILSDEEIRGMTKLKFKHIIKEKLQIKVMAYLIALQNKHTKSENLQCESKMQEYLTSSSLSISDKQFLFKLRSKMLKIKANYSSIYKGNLSCSLCLDEQTIENESHLLSCIIINQNMETKNVKYEDVFENVTKQKTTVTVFKNIMEFYEKQKKSNLPGAS